MRWSWRLGRVAGVDVYMHAILADSQQGSPARQGERVVGVLTRSELLSSLAQKGQGAVVG